MCCRTYPPGWPSGFITVWPVTGPLMEADGRVTADQASNFHVCLSCFQDLVMAAQLPRAARALALRSRDRWLSSQALLRQLNAIARDVGEAA